MDNLPLKANGFTLIELVLVILLIGIISAVAFIKWPALSLNLKAQTEQLANDLRYTQALSMTQNQRYCLKISSNTYQIIASSTSGIVKLAAGNTTTTLSSGISFGTLVPAGTVLYIFDGKGVPYTSTSTTCTTANVNAATALTSTGSIPLNGGGQTQTVNITPETGRITIS
jgi:MSHA pilin protein MshC